MKMKITKLFLMALYIIFCIGTIAMAEEDQNAFVNQKTGDVLSFRKVLSSEKIFILNDVFWLAYTDSLRLPGIKYENVSPCQSDCSLTVATIYTLKNRIYICGDAIEYSAMFNDGEGGGLKNKIWNLHAWEKVKPLLDSGIPMNFITRDLAYKNIPVEIFIKNPCKLIKIDHSVYAHFEKIRARTPKKIKTIAYIAKGQPLLAPDSEKIFLQLLEQSSQPITEGKIINAGKNVEWIDKFEHAKFPIICIDPDSHFQRLDKNDWKVNSFLNNQNGDFYLYISFEKLDDYPRYFSSRNFALDYLAGVNDCRQSVVGVILEPGKRMVLKHEDIKMSSPLIFALDKNGKIWKPNSPPADKNTIPNDRLQFILNPYILFGSWCPIWELNIWRRVGMMLKNHPEGIYLVGYGTLLQAEETQTVEEEHAFIQKHGVLITPELYTALEYLRKSQKDTSCPQ